MVGFYIREPELEFGNSRRHVDVRFGLTNHGPTDLREAQSPRQINLGLVGTPESTQKVAEWLDRCREVVPAPSDCKHPNLHPAFPGCNRDAGLMATVVLSASATRTFPKSALKDAEKLHGQRERVEGVVKLLENELAELIEHSPSVQVVMCAVPQELLNVVENVREAEEADDEKDAGVADRPSLKYDYHDLLKARAMRLRRPIQVIRPSTYDSSIRKKQKGRPERLQTLQDEATRAWNIHTALYYKAGGVPWRMVRESSALATCYVGVSFYKTLDQESLRTSVAQVFNERGEGVIVRGGLAEISKDDRQAHLSAEDAQKLLMAALGRYRSEHRTLPARVVIHKSSTHNLNELEGFNAALVEEGIYEADLVSLGRSDVRLSRAGMYPPLRGTVLSLGECDHVIYTKGSVDFFQTWPGQHLPAPRLMRIAQADQSPRFLAEELISLSKMNWNNTQFDGAEPITLRAARQVSTILRYCDEDQIIESRYSFYM